LTWSNQPAHSVHLLRLAPGSAQATDSILSTHVGVLGFAWNPSAPGLMNVTLVMMTTLDQSGSPDSLLTVHLLPQSILMIGT
jgi:hypothetical protein